MAKARLTYRFGDYDREPGIKKEGEEPREQDRDRKVVPLYEDEFHVVDNRTAEADPYVYDYGAWNSPFDAETQRIEKLIREAGERKKQREERGGLQSPEEQGQQERRQEPEEQGPHGRWPAEEEHGAQGRWPEEEHRPQGRWPAEEEHGPQRRWPQEDRQERESRQMRHGIRQLPHDPKIWPETDNPRPVKLEAVSGKTGRRDDYGYLYRQDEDERDYEPETGYYSHEGGLPPHNRWEDDGHIVRYSRTPWVKMTLSIAGAVIAGAMLGFVALSLFSGQGFPDFGGKSKASAVSASANPDSRQTSAAAGSASAASPVSRAASATAAAIPARTFTFLQAGGYSTLQAADSAAAGLRKKGMAAVTESGENSFVYIGMAPDKDSAKQLATHLQSQKIELYAKPVTLPAVSSIVWNGGADALQTFLTQGDQLVRMISGMTLVHLQEDSLTPVSDTSLQSVNRLYETWSAGVQAASAGAPQDAKLPLQKMVNALGTAKQSLDEYRKTPSDAVLWNAQTNLLQFVLAEKDLLKAIGSL